MTVQSFAVFRQSARYLQASRNDIAELLTILTVMQAIQTMIVTVLMRMTPTMMATKPTMRVGKQWKKKNLALTVQLIETQ
jgi:hypothetical protein